MKPDISILVEQLKKKKPAAEEQVSMITPQDAKRAAGRKLFDALKNDNVELFLRALDEVQTINELSEDMMESEDDNSIDD